MPEILLTIPTCSADSEKGMKLPLIWIGEIILAYSTNDSCPGGENASSFVFSGTKVTLYLSQYSMVRRRRFWRLWMSLAWKALSSAWPMQEIVLVPRLMPRWEELATWIWLLLANLYSLSLQRGYLYQNGVEFSQKVIGAGLNLFWGHLNSSSGGIRTFPSLMVT